MENKIFLILFLLGLTGIIFIIFNNDNNASVNADEYLMPECVTDADCGAYKTTGSNGLILEIYPTCKWCIQGQCKSTGPAKYCTAPREKRCNGNLLQTGTFYYTCAIPAGNPNADAECITEVVNTVSAIDCTDHSLYPVATPGASYDFQCVIPTCIDYGPFSIAQCELKDKAYSYPCTTEYGVDGVCLPGTGYNFTSACQTSD